jgi:hypothetical protein
VPPSPLTLRLFLTSRARAFMQTLGSDADVAGLLESSVLHAQIVAHAAEMESEERHIHELTAALEAGVAAGRAHSHTPEHRTQPGCGAHSDAGSGNKMLLPSASCLSVTLALAD